MSNLSPPPPSHRLDDPGVRLAIALVAAVGVAGGLALVASGDELRHLLVYDVPIAVPFALFLLDRWRPPARRPRGARALDIGVVAVALVRSVWLFPGVSGHALFLTYVLGSARRALLRVAAALVLAEVLYLKLAVWGDLTAVGGLVLGGLAALAERGLAASPDGAAQLAIRRPAASTASATSASPAASVANTGG